MACKCDAIRRCKEDIQTLGKMKGDIGHLVDKNTEIESNLYTLKDYMEEMISPPNNDSLQEHIKDLHKDVVELTEIMQSTCARKISQLNIDLVSLIAEDTKEHKEEK